MLKFCSAPWNTIHINQLGDISSCFCNSFHNKGWQGNIIASSLKELINSAWQEQFRSSIIDQSFKYCNSDTCVDFWRMDQVPNFDFVPTVPSLPTTIQLQIDRDCNLSCAICRNTKTYSDQIKPVAYRILEKLTSEYQHFQDKVNIHCDGSGDVFVSSTYQYFLRNHKLPDCFYLNIQTNGNLITKNKDLIIKLKDRIEMVEVSFDAATDETYKLVRGGNFSQVKQGVELLKTQGIEVWSQYVVHQQNYHEILDYVKLCKQLGVDKICLQLVQHSKHMTNLWWEQNRLDGNPAIDYVFLHSALAELKKDPQIEISGGLETLLIKKDARPIYIVHPI
jgi:MoaA/NifB/PqqE/SkfB family radical SAM enzyme